MSSYTTITKRDNIASFFSEQDVINNELYVPDLVARAAVTPQNDPQGFGAGPIVGLNQSLLNFQKIDIDAFDVDIDYQWKAGRFGGGRFSTHGTRTLNDTQQVAPVSPSNELVGVFGAPLKWTANASLSWDFRSWSAGWQTQYFDKYWLTSTHALVPNQGSASVPKQIYHDVYVSYQSGAAGLASDTNVSRGVLSAISVQLGVKNVLNTRPPIVASTNYSTLADPRRAHYYISLKKNF